MNLTENMLAVCPVATVVLRENGETEESGWYEWILRCWSSLPDARSLPDEDQLESRCQQFVLQLMAFPDTNYLRALTHPECPPSSLTMSKSSTQDLSP